MRKRIEVTPLQAAYGLQFNPREYVRDFDNSRIAVVRALCPHGCGLNLVLKPGVTIWESRHVKACGRTRKGPGLVARLAERRLE